MTVQPLQLQPTHIVAWLIRLVNLDLPDCRHDVLVLPLAFGASDANPVPVNFKLFAKRHFALQPLRLPFRVVLQDRFLSLVLRGLTLLFGGFAGAVKVIARRVTFAM